MFNSLMMLGSLAPISTTRIEASCAETHALSLFWDHGACKPVALQQKQKRYFRQHPALTLCNLLIGPI